MVATASSHFSAVAALLALGRGDGALPLFVDKGGVVSGRFTNGFFHCQVSGLPCNVRRGGG